MPIGALRGKKGTMDFVVSPTDVKHEEAFDDIILGVLQLLNGGRVGSEYVVIALDWSRCV